MSRHESRKSTVELDRERLIREVKKSRGGFRVAFEVEEHLFADGYFREYQPPQCILPRGLICNGDITVLASGRAYIYKRRQWHPLDVPGKPYTYSVVVDGDYYTFTQEELVEVEPEPPAVKTHTKTATRSGSGARGSGLSTLGYAGAGVLASVIAVASMGGKSESPAYGEDNSFPQDSGVTRSENLSSEQGTRVLVNGETYVAVRVPDNNFSGYAFKGLVPLKVGQYIGIYKVDSVSYSHEYGLTICMVKEGLSGADGQYDNGGW